MENPNSAVGIFDTPGSAQRAIERLLAGGLEVGKLSVLAAEQHGTNHAAGFCIDTRHLRYWGRHSTFWDGVWGVVPGAGLFWTPSAGPVLCGGLLVALAAGALESQAESGGLGAVGAGLYTLGIPKHAVLLCESAVRERKILLILIGSDDDADQARELFEGAGASETHRYTAPVLVGV